MNVLQNMMELYNKLPRESTYKGALNGILTHLDQVGDMTIYDIAELTNASRTTIWRLVQKMGYDNFSEFRHALKQAVHNYAHYNRLIPSGMAAPTDVIAQVSAEILSLSKAVSKTIRIDVLQKIIWRIKNAQEVVFYYPYNSCAISSFQQNLFMSGKSTGLHTLLPDMIENAKELHAGSIVFCAAVEHAETQDLSEVFRVLKKNKVYVCMTAKNGSRYKDYVDEFLFPEFDLNTVFSEIMFFDTMFLLLSDMYRNDNN